MPREALSSPMSPAVPNKAQYAANMVPLAARVVAAVHDEGPDELGEALARALEITPADGVDPYVTLTVILAAMVDPSRSPQELLAWTTPLGGVDAVTPPPPSNLDVGTDSSKIDGRVVEFCVDGLIPAGKLRRAERLQVARVLASCGWSSREIAERSGVNVRTAQRIRSDVAKRTAAA